MKQEQVEVQTNQALNKALNNPLNNPLNIPLINPLIKPSIDCKLMNHYQYGNYAEDMLISTLTKQGKRYIKVKEVHQDRYDNGKRKDSTIHKALMKDPYFLAGRIADIDIFQPQEGYHFPVDHSGISIKTISKSHIETHIKRGETDEVEYISLPFQKHTDKGIKKNYINKHLEHWNHPLEFTVRNGELALVKKKDLSWLVYDSGGQLKDVESVADPLKDLKKIIKLKFEGETIKWRNILPSHTVLVIGETCYAFLIPHLFKHLASPEVLPQLKLREGKPYDTGHYKLNSNVAIDRILVPSTLLKQFVVGSHKFTGEELQAVKDFYLNNDNTSGVIPYSSVLDS